ncbi:MAG: hypothetical protein AB1757_24520 [Acidobacteriota bacterium]
MQPNHKTNHKMMATGRTAQSDNVDIVLQFLFTILALIFLVIQTVVAQGTANPRFQEATSTQKLPVVEFFNNH